MDISSLVFLFLFLPVFLLVYLPCGQRFKQPVILAASIAFLAWGQKAAVLWLGGLLILGYLLGLVIARAKEKGRSYSIWVWIGIALNILVLSFFKLTTAFGEAGLIRIHFPQNWVSPAAQLAVPIGLSYVVFQLISYLVDVWRDDTPAERNFIAFSAYVLFFPKLLSGPITRYKPFALQMQELHPSAEKLAAGFRRLLAGFVKRALIANQMSLFSNAVFNLPTADVEPKFAWLALIAYTLQIYFDFSGYIDMAIGAGMMMGIQLPENFNFPYIAQSVGDFWRRWHITLAAWFRDYVFYPLERRRIPWIGQSLNILVVFLLTGLWHGFKPTFIVWGTVHGIALVVENLGLARLLKWLWRPIRHAYTLAVVMAAWVFFRSSSLDFAFEFFRRLAGDTAGLTLLPFSVTTPLPFIEPSFLMALAAGVLFSLPISSVWNRIRANVENRQAHFYLLFQVLEDTALVILFIAGIALLLSYNFFPVLYAKF
ncbi:MAG: MBOAT family protein [Chloroflexi bacterium]|nr:MBOAT family protein [Chloroflexota bacterium]